MTSDISATPIGDASTPEAKVVATGLVRVAEVGLLPAVLTRHVEDGRIRQLAQVLHLFGDSTEVARALIVGIEKATSAMAVENAKYAEVVEGLFGLAPGTRGLPYGKRSSLAAEAWYDHDDGLSDSYVPSFNRRHRPKVIEELGRCLRFICQADWRVVRPLPRASDADDRGNCFERLYASGHAHLGPRGSVRYHSDWTFLDVAQADRVSDFRLSTNAEQRVEIVPQSANVVSAEPLGLDMHGSQLWRIAFAETLGVGDLIEWSVRKVFHGPQTTRDNEWLSIAPKGRQSPNLVELCADFSDAGRTPVRAVKFVTPKGSLPDLRGIQSPLKVKDQRLDASFEDLTIWNSHGIYWWWA